MEQVCKVISQFNNESYICGTGFCVSTDGCIITSAHNIEECSAIFVVYKNRYYTAEHICNDRRLDIALLKIDCETIKCNLQIPNGYCKCYTFGYQYDNLCVTYQEGNVVIANYSSDTMIDSMITNLKGTKGTSGSPIYSWDGNVIGIINWYSDKLGSGGAIFELCIPVIEYMLKNHACPKRSSLKIITSTLTVQDIMYNKFCRGNRLIFGEIIGNSFMNELSKNDIIFAVNSQMLNGVYMSLEARLYLLEPLTQIVLSVLQVGDNFKAPKKVSVVTCEYPKQLDKQFHDSSLLISFM